MSDLTATTVESIVSTCTENTAAIAECLNQCFDDASHELAIYVRAGHPLTAHKEVTRELLDEYPLVSIRVPAELAEYVPGRATVDAKSGFLLPAIDQL